MDDPDVIRTRNLLIWSQTRYRCATESTLTAFMFSSVRDGYYSEQRRIRKTSQTNRSKISLIDPPDEMLNPALENKRNSGGILDESRKVTTKVKESQNNDTLKG
ncbi:unnamed protein product [Onchocerca flexuosa]|uniref:Uncharacterized protein n=1 Tax=Onchocerca flexuosa TaxID=387005 RepID=A0A183HXH1_9BILA|nr:unnamed protein product [Onchocerca flexuosa]